MAFIGDVFDNKRSHTLARRSSLRFYFQRNTKEGNILTDTKSMEFPSIARFSLSLSHTHTHFHSLVLDNVRIGSLKLDVVNSLFLGPYKRTYIAAPQCLLRRRRKSTSCRNPRHVIHLVDWGSYEGRCHNQRAELHSTSWVAARALRQLQSTI